MNLTNCDGTSTTKKYKFPGYTIRTMLFRPEFEGGKNFIFGQTLKKKCEGFVNHWCVSEEGKQYWMNKGLEGFIQYVNKFKDSDIDYKTFSR